MMPKKRFLAAAFILISSTTIQAQQLPDPTLVSSQLPTYPAIARLARVEGEVKLHFTLDQNGTPTTVTVVSGNPLLARSAADNIQTWKFELPKDLFRTDWTYETTFDYKLISGNLDPQHPQKFVVTLDSFRHVTIVAATPPDFVVKGCPTGNDAQPPTKTDPRDYVELSRSGCLGTCPVYTVRISANGDVAWKGESFVKAIGKAKAKISPEQARSVIDQFGSSGFWSLCASYSRNATDLSGVGVAVQIGERTKTVDDYGGAAPRWLDDLFVSVDAASDTHLWRHGDPKSEPFAYILDDAYLPKPGVTPLMRAAAAADMAKMKSLLESGGRVSGTDASGWTALMYAVTTMKSEPVQLLLRSGADPNQSSPTGDTALMASALTGGFNRDLAMADANVNARNSAGVTALMILAAKGDPDEIAAAIKAGANPRVKDARGRTALDYLRLANCDNSPLFYPFKISSWDDLRDRGCDEMDSDDFRRAQALLKAARNGSDRKKKTER